MGKRRESFSTAGAARFFQWRRLGRSPCLSNLPHATASCELSLGVGGKLGVCAPVGAPGLSDATGPLHGVVFAVFAVMRLQGHATTDAFMVAEATLTKSVAVSLGRIFTGQPTDLECPWRPRFSPCKQGPVQAASYNSGPKVAAWPAGSTELGATVELGLRRFSAGEIASCLAIILVTILLTQSDAVRCSPAVIGSDAGRSSDCRTP